MGGVSCSGGGKAGERCATSEKRSGCGERDHPWAEPDQAVVRAFRWSSNRTRSVSWLGPAFAGAHPRTKGARCFTGGHRHRIPSTGRVARSLVQRQNQGSGDPSGRTEIQERSEDAGCVAKNVALQPAPWAARGARCHDGRAVRAGDPAVYERDQSHAVGASGMTHSGNWSRCGRTPGMR